MDKNNLMLMISPQDLKKELKTVIKEVLNEKTTFEFSIKCFKVAKAARLMNLKYSTLRTKIDAGYIKTTPDGLITGAEILKYEDQ